MFSDPPQKRRWPRSQRFGLSTSGRDAEAAYRSTIVASRARAGRVSYDSARAEWAKALGIEPDDAPIRLEKRTVTRVRPAARGARGPAPRATAQSAFAIPRRRHSV
jgi:hypothetical protein